MSEQAFAAAKGRPKETTHHCCLCAIPRQESQGWPGGKAYLTPKELAGFIALRMCWYRAGCCGGKTSSVLFSPLKPGFIVEEKTLEVLPQTQTALYQHI